MEIRPDNFRQVTQVAPPGGARQIAFLFTEAPTADAGPPAPTPTRRLNGPGEPVLLGFTPKRPQRRRSSRSMFAPQDWPSPRRSNER